ncbi:MAG: hypothetical protein RL233_1802 [Bacteroidota bacterium]
MNFHHMNLFLKFRKNTYAIVLFVLVQCAAPLSASNYTYGSEIWATHITKNKYEISYRAYRVCGAMTSAPSSVFIVAYGGKNATCGTVSLTAPLISKSYIGLKCSTSIDCDKSNRFTEFIYKCTVNLDSSIFTNIMSGSSCKNITFAVYGYLVPTTLPCFNWDAWTSTTLYLENLANCSKTTNTPPARMFDPLRTIQLDRSIIFNQGLSDTTDRDVLRYELSPSNYEIPYKNKICVNTPTKDLSHPFTPTCAGTTLCSSNVKTNPVRGTFFDTTDGVFIFSPSVDGEIGVACVKVKEYRINKNGKYTLVAEHQREVAALVVDPNGKNESPKALLTQKTVLKVCVGTTVKQKFVEFEDALTPFQTVADSLQVIVPPTYRGASIKVYSSAKNKRSLEFNWTPTMADTFAEGYVFPIKVVDLNCAEPLSTTYNLIVKVYPYSSGSPQVVYKGCNKLNFFIDKFSGGSAPKVNWQVQDSSGKSLGTSNRVNDSIQLNGSGKYKISALLSNEGGCFKYWDTSINIIDTVVSFSLGNKKPFADTFNCPNGQIQLGPKNIVARKGSLTYQWYGMDASISVLTMNPRYVDFTTLTKIGNNKGIVIKTDKDTAVVLVITDVKGCIEAQQMNIKQIYSDPIQWKKSPLLPLCASDAPLNLIDPTNKNMLNGGPKSNIYFLNGKSLDRFGPNYYKLRAPSAIKGVDKIALSIVAAYDTLGCVSYDTNTIDVIYRPLFELANTKNICSGDSAFFLEDAVDKPTQNAMPYEWKIIGMPPKSIAQLMTLTVGGRRGTHLVTHIDSIAVGSYKLQACAVDSTFGCRACDTTTIIAKAQTKFTYTGDTLFCPNDAPFHFRSQLKISSNESSDTTYSVRLYSVNGNTNPSASIQKVFDKNSSVVTPRAAVGRVAIRVESSKYCYADGNIALRIQDTLPITFTVSPDTVIRLPQSSFTFTANTNSPRVWWYFGTGNKADTSLSDPITWLFDNKVANYKVSARSFHKNGCYGEFTKRISIWDVSGITRFDREAKITSELKLISGDWQFDALEVYDIQGKLIYQSRENNGVPMLKIAKGIYTYKIKAHTAQETVDKAGKWSNFGE